MDRGRTLRVGDDTAVAHPRVCPWLWMHPKPRSSTGATCESDALPSRRLPRTALSRTHPKNGKT